MNVLNQRAASSARVMASMSIAGVLAAAVCACSGGTTTGIGSGDGGMGTGTGTGTGSSTANGGPGTTAGSGTTSGHKGTSGSSTVNPAGSAPGEACNTSDDCLIIYCDCTNHSLVNAQRCVNNLCQTPSASCPAACMGFGTNWAGTSGLEKPRTSGSSGSSGTSGTSGACASFADCPSYTCTCLDGQTVSDQACSGGVCLGATTGCDTTCSNLGHGGAQ